MPEVARLRLRHRHGVVLQWQVRSLRSPSSALRVSLWRWLRVPAALSMLRIVERARQSLRRSRARWELPTMKSRWWVVWSLTACGGRALSPDPVSDASILDGGSDSSIDVDAGNGLRPCKLPTDCDGMQTCQAGYCCGGTMVGGRCLCGDEPGCNLTHQCCDLDSICVPGVHLACHTIADCQPLQQCPPN